MTPFFPPWLSLRKLEFYNVHFMPCFVHIQHTPQLQSSTQHAPECVIPSHHNIPSVLKIWNLGAPSCTVVQLPAGGLHLPCISISFCYQYLLVSVKNTCLSTDFWSKSEELAWNVIGRQAKYSYLYRQWRYDHCSNKKYTLLEKVEFCRDEMNRHSAVVLVVNVIESCRFQSRTPILGLF